MKRSLSGIAQACGGQLLGDDREFGGVSIDTRTLARGELFVALVGPRFDGHVFLDVAEKAGAVGAVVCAGKTPGSLEAIQKTLPLVVVPDTLRALTEFSRQWRAQFAIPVVGVGGSNGKTTVKEMTASILSQAGTCLATRGNLNNHIGVPLTLLRLEAAHRYAVVEMGANRLGDIAELSEIAHPTIGLIVNAGAEHLEGFGDLDGVARGEGEMVASLSADGTAVINADDAYAELWRGMSAARRILSFGLSAAADFRASNISQSIGEQGFELRFTLHTPAGSCPVVLQLAGRHNVTNALAASAAAYAAGADLAAIARGLAAVRAVNGRLQLKRTTGGAWVIDDSYNANPSSVRAALQVLRELPGEKWLVLGDMGELGEAARDSHIEAGALAKSHGVDRLFATGPLSALAVETFGTGAEWFPSVEALSARLLAEPGARATLLIKGSRFNRLERVVAALTNTDVKAH